MLINMLIFGRVKIMSRAKMAVVKKAKVEDRLKQLGMNQKELAEKMCFTPQSLSRALKTERISEYFLDRMGRVLDVAPEWLSGNIPDDFPHQYAIHLYQLNTVTPQQLVTTMVITLGYNPKNIDKKTFWKVYDVMRDAAADVLKESKKSERG